MCNTSGESGSLLMASVINSLKVIPNWLLSFLLPPADEVWGKVIFSEACVRNSVYRGEYLGRYPPGTRQVLPGPGRYTPQTRQLPSQTRQVYPSTTRQVPPCYQAGTLPGPGRYTPQQCMLGYTGISGRYASYWNAFLL